MKMSILAAAATIALTGFAPGLAAPAAAQHAVVRERTVVHTAPARRGWHTRKVCDWQKRGAHRVKVCRTVRYR